MSNKISEENISVALRFIVDNFGKSTLQDANRVNAILNDLTPKLFKESKWVKEAIELGVVKILLDDRNIDALNRKLSLDKAELMMKEEHISQERISFILDSFLYGLGWTNEKVDNNIKIKNSSKNYEENIKKEITIEDKKEKINNLNQDNSKNLKSENYSEENDVKIDNQIKNNNPNNTEIHNDENINQKNVKENNLNNKNKKYKILISLIILIAIGSMIYILFNNMGVNDVYAKEITFDVDYKIEGSKYVFKNEDFILMDVSLGGNKIDESKLNYNVEDNSICAISNEFNKCRITEIKEGTTIIHIYYGNKEIKSVNLEFKDTDANDISIKEISYSSNYTVKDGTYIFDINNPIDINVDLENSSEVDLSKLSFEVGDSNICEISSNESSCTITGINEGKTFLRILYDNKKVKFIPISFTKPDEEISDNKTTDNETSDLDKFESNSSVDLTVKHYLENYASAINSGEISYLSDCLTSDGDLYNELVKSVPSSYEKGITLEVLSYKKEKMTSEGNYYRTGYTIEYHIYKPEGEVYQKEYMEFIVVSSGSDWLIDKYENWKLLEQSEY